MKSTKNWKREKIGDALILVNGRAFKTTEWSEKGLPIIRIQNLNNGEAAFNYFEGELPEKYQVQDGDLLFAWSGTPGTSFGAHIWSRGKAWLNQHIYRVDFDKKEYNSRFLQLAINLDLDEYIKVAHGAAGLAHITKKEFESFDLPKPPLNEQIELVKNIESQFSRLDAAKSALEKVRANLKRYRASVLKAACEGKLVPTEAELARKEGRKNETVEFDTSSDTLSGKSRAGRLWGSGHVPDLSMAEKQMLSEGWVWKKVKELGENPEDAVQVGPMSMKSNEFRDEGLPVLNVGCVQWDRIEESKLNYLPENKAKKFDRYRIKEGDVLFTRSGTVGRCAVARAEQNDWLITFHLLRVRTNKERCIPDYLRIVFEGAPHIRRQTKDASIGSTRAGFNTRLLAELDIPLPTIKEQKRIVAAVEEYLLKVNEINNLVNNCFREIERNKHSILVEAFRGASE